MPEHATDVDGPRVSVVVPTYRRAERCRRLLEALAAQTMPASNFEVIAVDDCSEDGTVESLQSLAERLPYKLEVLRLPANGGPARARNQGWRAASGDLIAFIDDDCVPGPEWLIAGVQALSDSDRIGVVQGRTIPPPGHDGVGLPRWHHKQNITTATPYFESCNIFYRREALAAAGGFDERIGWWGEDTSLGWGVVNRGWQRSFAPDAVAIHDVECRGWRWHLSAGLWERNTVQLAKMHPAFRQQFWRPWAFRRREASLALAVVCLLLGLGWRPAWLGVAPYLWFSRESPRDPRFMRYWFENVTVDSARLTGHLLGSWRSGTLVL
jgi:GT2 family glycosyltransferase